MRVRLGAWVGVLMVEFWCASSFERISCLLYILGTLHFYSTFYMIVILIMWFSSTKSSTE